jgi:cyclase
VSGRRDAVPAVLTRRQVLRSGLLLAGGALAAPAIPAWARPAWTSQPQAGADAFNERRKVMGATPIESVTLTDRLTMLSGPGGNVVVLHGPDGKLVVDTFVQPAWDGLKAALDKIGNAKVTAVIDTHWHFDHSDNNHQFRRLGATVVAHENTPKRLAQPHDILGMKIPASPPEALPNKTFPVSLRMPLNGETAVLQHVPPAHTDTDIHIHFTNANVLHMGDLFFNGGYPFIDASTGGRIDGMIAAADGALKLVSDVTKIVPGHGPLAKKADLTKYRDMMATVRDRVYKLKTGGRKLEEVVAEAPTKDFDATWGKGFMDGKSFIALVYNTLP